MFDTQDMPEFLYSITTCLGITAEFNEESTIRFYDVDEEMIMQLDPADLMIIYAAYRAMVCERCEESAWRETDDTSTTRRNIDES